VTIDLPFLKDIDFTNPETLIFLAIFLVIAIIVLSVFFAMIAGIIKIIKRIIIRLFNIDIRKPKLNQKDTEWLHKQKVIQEQPEALSKMPSRIEGQKDNDYQEIKIPVPERFKAKSLEGQIGIVASERQGPTIEKSRSYQEMKAPVSVSGEPMQSRKFATIKSGAAYSPDASTLKSKKEMAGVRDTSIFGGKEEVSRIKLRHEMRYDPEIWKEQRLMGLNLSREEREGLINKIFPSVYGRNVSKRDLGQVLRRMGREWSSTTNMNKKAALRKEIKFFKKIGGIK